MYDIVCIYCAKSFLLRKGLAVCFMSMYKFYLFIYFFFSVNNSLLMLLRRIQN